ncbi:uncharacterized protein AKAW2_50261S [Aspergillus luchuensis]|uniref:Uncharacterized protein n=1 Tax=Aspergillus kawachii TaxID=1069201 RepID=A0A7R8A0F9_ASPKA|nr:uncharacterized protein AKAW2_50261S [Aspergillus luchuensis]BCR99919.1 hypothetical protein AKAW2_50261S [Aspergillus luchuensis]
MSVTTEDAIRPFLTYAPPGLFISYTPHGIVSARRQKTELPGCLGRSILTEKNDESERYWTLDVDSVATIERHEHPSDEAGKRVHTSLPCDLETRDRKLEEQVKHQDQENHRLHKRVSGICESVPTSLISPNLVVHFGTRLWKRNERRRAKEKGTERFSGQAGRGPTGQGLSYIA